MAEELELKKSITKAKREEMIYELMNNEELFSTLTSVQTQRLPIFAVSSLLVDESKKDAKSTLGPSVTISTAH